MLCLLCCLGARLQCHCGSEANGNANGNSCACLGHEQQGPRSSIILLTWSAPVEFQRGAPMQCDSFLAIPI
eukprot:2126546-Rhodomonas_salina.1